MTRLDAFFVKFPGIFFHLEGGKKLDFDFFFPFLSLALHCSVEFIQDASLYIMKLQQNWHSNLSPAVADEEDERIFGNFPAISGTVDGIDLVGLCKPFQYFGERSKP